MCGIAGFNREDTARIHRLTQLLEHRGPDQHGFHVGGGVSLGHRRLSILDLSEHGCQPLYNEDKTVCTVFNGEIFNYLELKKQLETHGHVFHSHTDTEVLVHGYEQWGQDLPTRLNGQFAFCIFDRNRQRLFLARDHFGIKPLYYYAAGDEFLFCSELKCFFESGFSSAIEPLSLDHYVLFGYMPSGRTILKDVCQLQPGHRLSYDLSRQSFEVSRYWDWRFAPDENQKEEEILPELKSRLQTAVQRQLISDVPLGAFLSGGVDSSALVSLMRKHVSALKTFSIRFDHAEFNESRYAAIVSRQFQTDHHEIEFTAEHVKALIGKLPYHYDEPFADTSMIPTWLVSSVAREHVTVCLSGTGGDELLAGYPRYRQLGVLSALNRLPRPARAAADAMVALANRWLKKDLLNKLRVFLREPVSEAVLYGMLLSYMFRSRDEAWDPQTFGDDFTRAFCYADRLENMQNYDLRHYLPDCLFVKEDRAAMAVSLEVRVPFLDIDFAEYAFRIPTRLKMYKGQKKYLLKKAFAGVLPDAILYRRKQGFGVPLVHYFRKELRAFAKEILFDPVCSEYFPPKQVERYWNLHQAGGSDYSRILWSVMMFKMWYRQWMR
ncbi:MAG: asparagine synthase (glutamine-hydrolyzing) [Planctomycetaceae bacterium]|nr:asparagine synthase (glutamine-hydrolyzing) [Planctomycetaceae bacterium]